MRLLSGLLALQLIVIGGPPKPPVPSDSGLCDAANVAAGASNCPLLTETMVLGAYVGVAKSYGLSGGYDQAYDQTEMLAYDASSDTVFVTADNAAICEMSLPGWVNTTTEASMPQMTFVQACVDPGNGNLATDTPSAVGYRLGSLLVTPSYVYFGSWGYYDADVAQVNSHGRISRTLASGGYSGLTRFTVGGNNTPAGWCAALATPIPSEWQTALGGTSLCSGFAGLPIISRSSYGPSAIAINEASIYVDSAPISSHWLLGYDGAHKTLGEWTPANGNVTDIWNGTSGASGMVIIPETRSLLFFGAHGYGPFCYGTGTTDPDLHGDPVPGEPGNIYCYDPPNDGNHSQHAYPYRYQIWAYDLNELKAVKDGSMSPWELEPYDWWEVTFPTASLEGKPTTGMAYKASTHTLMLGQGRALGGMVYPLLHAFTVDVTP